jgi:transcriptional regulator with XRE-family HTH domain
MYNPNLMLVNQRIREIRRYRRLEGRELALSARLSPAEVSHVERKMRNPKTDTLQRIAAALEVNTGYLLGEEDADLPLPQALARQSLKVFLRLNRVTPQEETYVSRICLLDSAPETVKGWRDLLANVANAPGQEAFFGTKSI